LEVDEGLPPHRQGDRGGEVVNDCDEARERRDAELIADALKTAGFDPPPYVGEDWIDRGLTSLPDGHRSIVRITALGNTVTGWQARVQRRQVDADGNEVEGGGGRGCIYVAHLFGQRFPGIFKYERVVK
jgi:hypothetical protein